MNPEQLPQESINNPVQDTTGIQYSSVNGQSDAMNSQTASKGRGSRFLIGLVAVLFGFLLIIGLAGLAYLKIYMPRKPQVQLANAIVETLRSTQTTNTHYSGQVTFSGKDVPKWVSEIVITGESATNGDAAFTARTDIKANDSTNVATFVFETKFLSKAFFAKAGGVDRFEQFLIQSGLQDKYKSWSAPLQATNDNWYEFNADLSRRLPGRPITLPDAPHLVQGDVDKIVKAYEAHPFMTALENLPDEAIFGETSTRIRVSVQKEELSAFLSEMKDSDIPILKPLVVIYNANAKRIPSLYIDFRQFPLEIWIDKKTKLVNQVSFSLTTKEVTTNVKLAFKDRGQTVYVQKPTTSRSMLELVTTLAPAIGNGYKVDPDELRKADANRVLTELQSYVANKNVQYPPTGGPEWDEFYAAYIKILDLKDPATRDQYVFVGNSEPIVGQMSYMKGVRCDGGKVVAVASGEQRVAILVGLTSGRYCIDNGS